MEAITTAKDILTQKYGFTPADFAQIQAYGIALDKILSELELFETGIPKVHLIRPAVIQDGIQQLSLAGFRAYAQFFDQRKTGLKLKKFVPASGAASRMFKFLNEFLNEFDPEKETINAYINRRSDKDLPLFLAGIEKFPFYDQVKARLKEVHPDYYTLESHEKSYRFIQLMLNPQEFDFAGKPKGTLPFHRYNMHTATPVEEHLNECAHYAAAEGVSYLHLTVSESHKNLFETIVERVREKVEKKTGTTTHVSFSFQDKSTDTIAVDSQNKPFRSEAGTLVFRPAGHGALINNLNQLDADVVFIKNIDNVIQNHIAETTLYKKALAGMLLDLQQQVFQALNDIKSGQLGENEIPALKAFLSEKLHTNLPEDFDRFTTPKKLELLQQALNRPIRVCGMVRNEGEPGGGPFWVKDSQGRLSLQIVESAQADTQDAQQLEILRQATHFNPVDLVCAIKDHQGNKFDLGQFIDPDTGFIAHKNSKGRDLKGYELPGLWNGAMARWITVFVEVPLLTFNPVKTVNDLLKPAHQPQDEY